MDSAAGATYISKKYIQAYEEKRSKHIAKKKEKESKKLQLQSVKEEEDDMVIKPKGSVGETVDQQPQQMEQQQLGEQPQQKKAVVSKPKSNSGSSASDDSDNDRNSIGGGYRSVEEVHSDELEGDLNLSDCEDNSRVQNVRGQKKMAKMAYKKAPARVFRQEIDTNIFKIGFKTLADKADIASGDPTECANCKAFFNFFSKLEEEKSDDHEEEQVWVCEFCGHKNPVDIEEEEKPKNKAVNFILEAAAQVQDKKAKGSQDISVVFCIDQSGSMCVSQPVKGKHQLKGDRNSELQEFMKFSDGSDQRMQNERNVTYVSRMQCLQAAIDQQITDMSNGATDRKLGIVSFNNEVTVIGDGGQDPVTIGGDKLFDQEFLMSNGAKLAQDSMKLTVKDSAKQLQKKLLSMEETGPTALGPAVATSIAMAAGTGVVGSQVVICTDGLANVGLGSFDEAKTDDEIAAVEKFYTTLGEFAKEKGLTINIISIIGDDCNLDALSKLAEMTGGEVERVNPVELTNNFANILSQPIIASNVVSKVKLHKGLMFRNEDPEHLSEDMSLMTREIGNVTADTEITFEYTMKKISELVKMEDFDLTKVTHLPFQVQITYKALDGSKCIRVITEQQTISNDRQKLEQGANFQILGMNAIRQTANIARSGNVRFAQANAKQWKRKMGHIAQTETQKQVHGQYIDRFADVYNQMQVQEDVIQKSSAPMFGSVSKAKKAAPKMKMMKMQRQASDEDNSDVEDNAFGSAFNKDAKKQKAKKSKGGFFGSLFGGSKSSAAKESPQVEELSSNQALGAMPQMQQMQMENMEQMDAFNDDYGQEEQVESSAFASKKSKKAPAKRFHQDDALASNLYKASKFSKF